MDKILASLLNENLQFEYVLSYWQNNHNKTILRKAI